MAEDDDDHRDLVRLAVVGGGGGGRGFFFKLASRAGVLGLSRGQRARFRALYEELGAARMARKPWTAIWRRMKAGNDALSDGPGGAKGANYRRVKNYGAALRRGAPGSSARARSNARRRGYDRRWRAKRRRAKAAAARAAYRRLDGATKERFREKTLRYHCSPQWRKIARSGKIKAYPRGAGKKKKNRRYKDAAWFGSSFEGAVLHCMTRHGDETARLGLKVFVIDADHEQHADMVAFGQWTKHCKGFFYVEGDVMVGGGVEGVAVCDVSLGGDDDDGDGGGEGGGGDDQC